MQLYLVTLLHGCFSRFLSYTNDTKLCKASHIILPMITKFSYSDLCHSFFHAAPMKIFNESILQATKKSFQEMKVKLVKFEIIWETLVRVRILQKLRLVGSGLCASGSSSSALVHSKFINIKVRLEKTFKKLQNLVCGYFMRNILW